jgi:ABC-type uncharacterized transport system involved in gliding motility auxiliary subunit
MKNFSILGIIGLFLLGAGLVTGFIQGKNDMVSILPISLGALLIVAYLLFDLKKIFAFLGSKGFKYGTNSAVMTLIFLAILVFLQVIVSTKKVQFDITEDKKFTLSEQTGKVLDNLKQKIELFAFVDKRDTRAKDLLEQYKTKSANISYEIIDPNVNPGRAKQYDIKALNTIVLVNGLKQEKISEINEEKMTNALIKVTRDGQKTIYFVQGHGEKSFTDSGKDGMSTLNDELVKQNYLVKNLILLQNKDVPADASSVILAGVHKDLLPEETKTLDEYINKGGRVLIMVDPDSAPGIRKYLAGYGLRVRDDIIVDKLSRAFGGDFLVPMVPSYGQHAITSDLKAMSFFPLTSSIDISKPVNNITIENIASTTENSWGEVNKEMLKKNQAGLDPEDARGPLTIAAVATKKLEGAKSTDPKDEKKEKSGELLAFGDSDFASNSNFQLPGNSDLILNSVNWLAQEEDLMAIRPKDKKSTPLMMTQTQGRLLLWSSLVFLPLGVVLFGIFVTSRRRLRAA